MRPTKPSCYPLKWQKVQLTVDNTACRERKTVKKISNWFTETTCLEWCRSIDEKTIEGKMACEHLESRSPMLLSHHKVRRTQEEKKNTVSRLALTSAMNSKHFSDMFGWTILKKYKRNFPEKPRNNRKSQSPNLSVYQEIIENTLSSAALTIIWI